MYQPPSVGARATTCSRSMPCVRKRRRRAASASSSVLARPPSPVVMALTGWSEKHVMSAPPGPPTIAPSRWPPSAWQPSSMTATSPRDAVERREVDGQAGERHGHDGLRARPDGGAAAAQSRFSVPGRRRRSARAALVEDAVRRGGEGDRRDERLVAGADPAAMRGAVQRRGTAGERDGVTWRRRSRRPPLEAAIRGPWVMSGSRRAAATASTSSSVISWRPYGRNVCVTRPP